MQASRDRVVLVTGAAGLVGRAVVERLVRAGERVRVLAHVTPVEVPGVDVVTGDLCEPESLEPVVDGVAAVVHAAALLAGDEAGLQAVNVDGTRRLAARARDAGVERFVLFSSATVYGPGPLLDADEDTPLVPVDPYPVSKLEAERSAQRVLGDRLTVLRPGGIYRSGPCPLLEQAAGLASMPALPLVDAGRVPFDLVHVDDLAELVFLALQAATTGVFNVAGPEPAPFREVLDTIASAFGTTPRWLPVDDSTVFEAAAVAAASVPRTLSTARAERLLGYAPTRRWQEEIPKAVRRALG